jgi:uncharacterized membrane protein YoaK (UPF0700 family)
MQQMDPAQRRALCLAFGLAAVAGCVDSLGYLALNGFFVSFMSGNSTRFAVGLAAAEPHAMRVAGGLLALFVSGVVLGALLARPRGALALVAILLASGAACAGLGRGVPSALALGIANTVVQRAGRVSIAATYMTGTLVRMGQGLAEALRGGDRLGWLPYALLWCALLSGAVIGAALFQHFGLRGLWLPAATCAVLTLIRLSPER